MYSYSIMICYVTVVGGYTIMIGNVTTNYTFTLSKIH